MINKKNIFNSKIRVPFFQPYISKSDHDVVDRTLGSNILTNGPIIEKFEASFSKFTNSKFSIGVSSATAALHLSLKSLGIGSGDEVLVPDITFVATANSVLMTGATPVLVDIDSNDLNIDINSIKENISKKTRAIIPVHLAGQSCKMKEILDIAKKHQLSIIEDCAHALGTKYQNKHVGTFGDLGCFSFYPTKNITTLEGGMIVTNTSQHYKKLLSSRNHGISRDLLDRYSKGYPWEYDILEPGYNYRMDEIRASLGINQLKRINQINSKRRNIFKYYTKKLSQIKGLTLPSVTNLENNSCHLYIVRINEEKFGMTRNKLFQKLLSTGIQTSVHYKPLHQFTLFKKHSKIFSELKNSKTISKELLSLPLYPTITKSKLDYVIKILDQLSRK